MPTTRARKPGTRKRVSRKGRSLLAQREFWAVSLTVISIITLITLLFSGQGILGERWAATLRQIFGRLGAFIVALVWLAGSVTLLAWEHVEPHFHPRWQSVAGSVFIFLCLLGFLHIVAGRDYLALARNGIGGGYVGLVMTLILTPWLGRAVSLIVLVFGMLVGVCLVFGLRRKDIAQALQLTASRIWSWLRLLTRQLRILFLPQVSDPVAAKHLPLRPATIKPPVTNKPVREPAPKIRIPPVEPPISRKARATIRQVPAGLPPLDILAPDQGLENDDSDARARAETIERTLRAFGIPVSVTEWHRGPVVTQFGLEPGYIERVDRDGNITQTKVRVNKILALSNDLALALAAAPIRIEAPVPGRSVVGIEVPNGIKSLVGLRGVLESEQFQKNRAPLRFALGRDVSGQAVVADLATMPHLLVAGATGSGKSACLNAIIASLLFYNQPDQVKLLLVDPKRVELTNYNGIPHLIAPVVVDIEKVIIALRWVTHEMERRYAIFAKLGVRDIGSYSRLLPSDELEPLPMIVVIIDELADMMLAAPEDVEQTLCRIAQMARATGIHLVIATQRPSVDVVTGLIKANFPARISFLVTSQVDSRVILDAPGAEKLLGRGDMLFMAPDSPKLERIQGCYVFDKELEALVAFWRHVKAQQIMGPEEQAAPWEGIPFDSEEPDDPLLQQAAELVREHNQASASFLQRQMRIGYPRAARLIDQLEAIGVVGPAEAGGRSRSVLLEQHTNIEAETEPASEALDEQYKPPPENSESEV